MRAVFDHALTRRHERGTHPGGAGQQVFDVDIRDPRRGGFELSDGIALFQPRYVTRIVVDTQTRHARAFDQRRRSARRVRPTDGLGLDHQHQAIRARALAGFREPLEHLLRHFLARHRRSAFFGRARLVKAEHDQPRKIPSMRPLRRPRIHFRHLARKARLIFGQLE